MFALVALVSIGMMAASLVVAPWLLTRIPADYFLQAKPHFLEKLRGASPREAFILAAKNIAGIILFWLGVVMLVLPGQGLVTMVLALILIDFPGKFAIERWLVSRGKVLASINWLRERAHRPPLLVHHDDAKP